MNEFIPPDKSTGTPKNIAQMLAHNAERYPAHIWMTAPESGQKITWKQAHSRASDIAASLISMGVKTGQSVALAASNSIGTALSLLGIMMAGGRATPLNLVAGSKVMAYVLNHSEAGIILVDDDARPLIEEAVRITARTVNLVRLEGETGPVFDAPAFADNLPSLEAEMPALLMYTSGTTGNPKGVLLSHENLLHAGKNVALAHQITMADTGLCVLPLYHINGLCVSIMGSLVSASGLVMPPRFSKSRFWSYVTSHDCSWFSAVPTLFSYLLNDEARPDLSSCRLRFARSASAPLPPETHRQFENRFGIPIIETMGLTETGAQILSNPLPPGERKIGSPGMAVGNEIKIINPESLQDMPANQEGEIVVRGKNVMLGYLNQPDETAKTILPDGWLRSGDLGRMDEDGYIFVTGRIKELIIKGGENIAPREIDEVLLEHDAILEAAAFARPCKDYGQRVEACIAFKEGRSAAVQDVLHHCTDKLGTFKTPDKIHILPELPKGPSGKIQRMKLIDLVPSSA